MKSHSSSHGHHGLGATLHNAWITAGVKSSLALAKATRSQGIHVKTHDGEVFLDGMVNSHQQRNEAIRLAGAIHGVVRVDATGLNVSLSASDRPFEAADAEEHTDYQTGSAQQSTQNEQQKERH